MVANMLKVVLSIYMGDLSSPLPTLEEVLLCSEQTSEEEVQIWTVIVPCSIRHLLYYAIRKAKVIQLSDTTCIHRT